MPDGFGHPLLAEFDEDKVMPELGLGNGFRIHFEVVVDQADMSIIGMTGAVGVIMKSQEIGEPGHGGIRVVVIHWIGIITGGGTIAGGWDAGSVWLQIGSFASNGIVGLRVGEWRLGVGFIGAFHAPQL